MDSQWGSRLKTKGFDGLWQQLTRCCHLSLLLFVAACHSLVTVDVPSVGQQSQPVDFNKRLANNPTETMTALHQPPLQSDIPLLTLSHLDLNYWLAKDAEADKVLLGLPQVQQFNQKLIDTLPEVIAVFNQPDVYSQAAVKKLITALSHPSQHPRFSKAGELLHQQHWRRYHEMLALSLIPPEVNSRFALVTSRGILRTYPTNEPVFSSATDQRLDRFQETAVFPGEALQVLHYSDDRKWAFVRHYHYNGWLAVQHFATTQKAIARQFVQAEDFILVTGARAVTNLTAQLPQASAISLDMGVKLPRVRQHAAVIHGQNSSFSYVVKLPIRQPNGQLQLVDALIARNQDVSEHYLAFSKANILRQAFKFLGEHYGWGHALNARDCSGFIGEVFRTFGFILPRNTGSQGLASFGAIVNLTAATLPQRQLALRQAQMGDLIFMPGHVMLVLGQVQGETFVIHDVAGLHYYRPDGRFYDSVLNGVSITPLSPLQRNPQQSYVDSIYLLKSLGREFYANPAN